jgi:hypothetical protein
MSKFYKRTIILLCSISFLLGLFFQYVSIYYRYDVSDLDFYNALEIEKKEYDGMLTYGNDDSKLGIVFYPGAKVEYTSYEPLMKQLAPKGIFCVLIEMPYNLPVFGISSAEGIQELYPDIDKWYMMGHSLGGAMAGTYLVDNYRDYEGLILLGSYVSDSLVHTDLNIISIYGSEDKILNKGSYEKYKVNYPKSFEEMIIYGGNHSYFGVYGVQKGDGKATITNEQQIQQTVDVIKLFVLD